MRLAAALLITLLASTANAMPPQQQALWEIMQQLAPGYEGMLACDKQHTAEMIETLVGETASRVIASDQDLGIVLDMWALARQTAYFNYFKVLAKMRQDPNGNDCNQLELLLVQNLRQGI